jgi:hypothetical protein
MNKEQRDLLRELANKSTKVVAWYPHSQYEGFSGGATVRGPYHRWFTVKPGSSGTGDEINNPAPVSDPYDDAKFCAAAMNNLVSLLDELDKKDQIITELKTMLKDVL